MNMFQGFLCSAARSKACRIICQFWSRLLQKRGVWQRLPPVRPWPRCTVGCRPSSLFSRWGRWWKMEGSCSRFLLLLTFHSFSRVSSTNTWKSRGDQQKTECLRRSPMSPCWQWSVWIRSELRLSLSGSPGGIWHRTPARSIRTVWAGEHHLHAGLTREAAPGAVDISERLLLSDGLLDLLQNQVQLFGAPQVLLLGWVETFSQSQELSLVDVDHISCKGDNRGSSFHVWTTFTGRSLFIQNICMV